MNPANALDPWPGELLATSAEGSITQFLKALQAGDSARLRGMITRDVRGSVPASGADEAATELSGESLLGGVRAAFGWAGGSAALDDVVEVSVTEVEAPDLLEPEDANGAASFKSGRTIALVRVGTRPESGVGESAQRLVTLDVGWRLGRRVRIAEFSVREVVKTAGAAPFRDVTAAVLGVDGGRDGDLSRLLGLGALEAYQRTDQLCSAADLYLAMHGVAVGDLDGNGWEDLVVGRATGQPNLCFMNDGGRFTEEGEARGLDVLEDTGGLLIVDLDGDGARDVVFGRGPTVVIMWNQAGRFEELTTLEAPEATARVYSISAADVDRDGDLDLYDTRYFRSGGYGAQAPTPYHDAMNGAANVFWRNRLVDADGDMARAFRDDTAAVGLDAENDRFSLTSVFDDLDGDGDLDLYVANDFGQNSFYAWEGDRFRTASEASGLTDKAAGMGISIADVNLDGESDIVVSNMHSVAGMRVTREGGFGLGLDGETRGEFARHARGNTLYEGLGGGRYRDVSSSAGASPGGWAWGARFVDWDRDGLVDIVVPNGFLSGRGGPDLQSFFWRRVVGTTPLKFDAPAPEIDHYLAGWGAISHLSQFAQQHWNAHERTFAYANKGGFQFDDVTLASGLGFADDGRALVTADLDRDGRLDLVFRNRTSPTLRVLQGVSALGAAAEGAGWLALTLEDRAPNRDAVGGLVELVVAGVRRSARVTAGDGYLGSSTKTLHFGVGEAKAVESLTVTWPDGTGESFSPTGGGESLVDGAWLLVRGTGEPAPVDRGLPSFPALGRKVPAPMAAAAPGPPAMRVPLLEPFPLGAWRLPFFDGPAQRIDEATGTEGTLALVWTATEPSSRDALMAIQGSQAALAAAGVRIHPLCLDGVRAEEAALRQLGEIGLAGPLRGGRMGRADRTVLEMLLARTLAPYDDLPLPVGLLFDNQGRLVELWMGGLQMEALLADVGRMASRADGATTLLGGGRWIAGPPTRYLDDVPAKLKGVGLTELGLYLEQAR